jgi:hypothetical protein
LLLSCSSSVLHSLWLRASHDDYIYTHTQDDENDDSFFPFKLFRCFRRDVDIIHSRVDGSFRAIV